jgi:hypothetical protein
MEETEILGKRRGGQLRIYIRSLKTAARDIASADTQSIQAEIQLGESYP